MGHPRIHIIALVGAGAISSSAIFCVLLMYFFPDPSRMAAIDEELLAHGNEPAINPIEATIAVLRDPDLPLSTRRVAAFDLAESGTDEALMELLLAASTASPFMKAAIAESLANFNHADARRFLVTLLDDREEMVGRAAVRSLAARGDLAGLERVSKVLLDGERPVSVRVEAAVALGRSDHPEATNLLLQATHSSFESEEIRPVFQHILDALARRLSGGEPVAWTRDSQYFLLASDDGKKGGTAGFLVAFLADEDPEVRRTAARSLSTTSDVNPVVADIIACLKRETEPEVRIHLYRALEGYGRIDCDSVLALIREEPDHSVRLAGFNCLAAVVSNGASAAAIDFFDYSAVPELRQVAVHGDDLQLKLSSIIALQRSRTGRAEQALREIAKNAPETRVREAALAAADFSRVGPLATVE
jgi:HEAT repeat protein